MNSIKIFKIPSIIFLVTFTFIFSSCDGDKFQKENIDGFEGTWELQGRTMFDGVIIKIDRNKSGDFKGKILSLNENKFVKIFAKTNDIWVYGISRNSNYEFKLTEKKIGGALFSLYGLDTSKDFKVQFINKNTIGLSAGGSNPKTSTVRYVRVVEEENE
jgi:hypothetical protein